MTDRGAREGPTIGVAIAAYNCERWLEATLESVLGQSRPADRVVVVDDGSTDGTAGVLARYGERVHVVRQPNAGPALALNRAAEATGCDYVAFSGADDIWGERKLERQFAALARHPELDVLFTHGSTFGAEERQAERPCGKGVLDTRALACTMYERGNIIVAPSAMVRSTLFRRLGGFSPSCDAEDYDLWMRCLELGAVFFYDPAPLVRSLRHGGNLSSNLLRMQHSCLAIHRRYANLAADAGVVRRTVARDHFMIGRLLVDAGSLAEARRSFLHSIGKRPRPRAFGWAIALSLPPAVQRRVVPALVSAKRWLARQAGDHPDAGAAATAGLAQPDG